MCPGPGEAKRAEDFQDKSWGTTPVLSERGVRWDELRVRRGASLALLRSRLGDLPEEVRLCFP